MTGSLWVLSPRAMNDVVKGWLSKVPLTLTSPEGATDLD